MKNGKCPAGEYYCYTNKECKPIPKGFMVDPEGMLRKENGASTTKEEWSQKYKKSIDCDNPKGFSQKAHCRGRKMNEQYMTTQQKAERYAERLVNQARGVSAAYDAAKKKAENVKTTPGSVTVRERRPS